MWVHTTIRFVACACEQGHFCALRLHLTNVWKGQRGRWNTDMLLGVQMTFLNYASSSCIATDGFSLIAHNKIGNPIWSARQNLRLLFLSSHELVAGDVTCLKGLWILLSHEKGGQGNGGSWYKSLCDLICCFCARGESRTVWSWRLSSLYLCFIALPKCGFIATSYDSWTGILYSLQHCPFSTKRQSLRLATTKCHGSWAMAELQGGPFAALEYLMCSL